MGLVLGLGMLGLILDSRTAMQGALEGVELCLTAVIPSLLPFLCLSMCLTDRLWGRKSRALGLLGRLFRLPEGAEALLIPALLGGYPAGAACVGRAMERGQTSKEDAQRLLGFCGNPGPAFLFGIVGHQFRSPLAAWGLWALVIAGAVAAAWVLPSCRGTVKVSGGSGGDALGAAGAAMGKICVLVILFRVGLCFLRTYLPLDGTALVAVQGLVELTNGCCALANVPSEKTRFLLAAGMVCFGGLCVGLQTGQVTKGLSLKFYWLGKLIQTLTALTLGWMVLEKVWILGVGLLLGAILLKKSRKTVAFFRNRVYTTYKKDTGRKPCFSVRK